MWCVKWFHMKLHVESNNISCKKCHFQGSNLDSNITSNCPDGHFPNPKKNRNSKFQAVPKLGKT